MTVEDKLALAANVVTAEKSATYINLTNSEIAELNRRLQLVGHQWEFATHQPKGLTSADIPVAQLKEFAVILGAA